jgi:long-chain fatty acid transport protein
VTDDLSLGLVYRSRINHRIEGDFDMNGKTPYGPVKADGDAHAKLTLPASVVMGANYDFTKKFRGGASITWTEWSTVNHIDFNLPNLTLPGGATKNPSYAQELNWHDAWRLGFGFEYDLTDSFTGRIGYSFDWDPSAEAHGTTMLPPGDRHIVGFGASYKFLDDWRIDLGYSFIMMESETRMVEGVRFQCDNSYSHLVSASIAYTF